LSERNDDLNTMLGRLWTIMGRRRWWILSTTMMIFIGTILVSFALPMRYRSEATIFVHKDRAPERYVIPNDTSNSMAQLDAMTSQILSSANLLGIISEFNLYPDQRNHAESGALVARIRASIEVQPLNKNPERSGTNAFMIAFTGNDPRVAQQVANRLTSLFIEENQQAQENRDTGMTNFLKSELDAASTNLTGQEAALRDFKMKNLGQLPEQEAGNLEILSGLQIQLQTAQANLARSRQQRAYLQAMLSQSASGFYAANGQPSLSASPTVSLRADIARLRAERDELLSRYSPLYPDVISLNQRISSEEARLNHLLSTPESSSAANSQTPLSTAITDPGTAQLKSQFEANRIEAADDEREVVQLEARIASYRNRLNLAPLREQQLAEVARNYDLAKQNYTNLVNKKTESELATKLAVRQLDQQFQIIDPPSLPLRPSSPQRPAIALGGLVGGLILGVLLAFFIEARDHSFRSVKEIRAFISLPLLVTVPSLRSSTEEHRLAWKVRVDWALGSVMVLLMLAVQIFVFLKG